MIPIEWLLSIGILTANYFLKSLDINEIELDINESESEVNDMKKQNAKEMDYAEYEKQRQITIKKENERFEAMKRSQKVLNNVSLILAIVSFLVAIAKFN